MNVVPVEVRPDQQMLGPAGALFSASLVVFALLFALLLNLSGNDGLLRDPDTFWHIGVQYLCTLSVMSELWNHYAAAVFRSKLPFTTIPVARGYRIAGVSHMNFVALVSHGLSAISVFGDIVGVRLLITSLMDSLIAGFGILCRGNPIVYGLGNSWMGYLRYRNPYCDLDSIRYYCRQLYVRRAVQSH